MRLKTLMLASAMLSAMTCAAFAGQEPFGENIGAWKFTQAEHSTGVICRAFADGKGVNIIGRTGDGAFYVSVPAQMPKGSYEESSITIGGENEMVNTTSDGARYVTPVDDDQIKRIVKNGGYVWAAAVPGKNVEGYVSFDDKVGAAVKRLRECTKANVGR